MIVPWQQIAPQTLRNLVEEFVTRDGTDYGEREVPLEQRVARVETLLSQGRAVVWFDDTTDTVTLLMRDQLPRQ